MDIHTLMHAKTINKKRGHDFVREWGEVWVGLDRGKEKEKCNYTIITKVQNFKKSKSGPIFNSFIFKPKQLTFAI